MHQARELQRLARGDVVIVHDVERIAGLPHVQPRQRAPGAADRVEGTVFAVVQHVEVFERLLDEFFRLLERAAGDVLQGEAAERQRHAAAHARAVHVDQFERAAAEVADDAVRLVDAGHDAERGEMGFAFARQDRNRRAADARRLGDEGAPVARVAAGGGGDRPDLAHMQDVAQRAKTLERVERGVDSVRRQQTGRLHLAAEAGQHFFIEDRRRGARQPFIDDEADRVRTDIDDRDRRPVIEPALGLVRARMLDGRPLTPLRRGGV